MNTISVTAEPNQDTFWDTVGVIRNGAIFDNARRFTLHLVVGDDESDYGIRDGGELFGENDNIAPSMVLENGDGITDANGNYQDGTLGIADIFPGSFEVQLGNRAIRIENFDPSGNFLSTRVLIDGTDGMEGLDVSNGIAEVHIDIDAINNTPVVAWYKRATSEAWGAVNYETVALI